MDGNGEKVNLQLDYRSVGLCAVVWMVSCWTALDWTGLDCTERDWTGPQ
jgi:hypothetical protein